VGYFLGADAMGSPDFIKEAGNNDDKTFATLVGLPAAKLTDWHGRYQQRGYQGDKGDDFAPFGYMAMQVALNAVKNAAITNCGADCTEAQRDANREAVRAQVARTGSDQLNGSPNFGTPWQFDANGDTTLGIISTQRVGTQGWIYDHRMTGAKTEWKIDQ
jgi:hypothetical protein